MRRFPDRCRFNLRRTHPITDLGGNDLPSVWRKLPPLTGANRWFGPKVAPGVEVLLETATNSH